MKRLLKFWPATLLLAFCVGWFLPHHLNPPPGYTIECDGNGHYRYSHVVALSPPLVKGDSGTAVYAFGDMGNSRRWRWQAVQDAWDAEGDRVGTWEKCP